MSSPAGFETDDVSVLTTDLQDLLIAPLPLDWSPSVDATQSISALTEENSRLKAEIQSLQQTIETQEKKFQAETNIQEQKHQADLNAKDTVIQNLQTKLASIRSFASLLLEEQRGPNRRRGVARLATPFDRRPCNHSAIKTVGEAWQEWEYGICGNRAVKDWPKSAHKHTFYKRAGLYHCLRDLVDSGWSHSAAVSLVEREYVGWNNILKISADLKKRKRNGTLPPSFIV